MIYLTEKLLSELLNIEKSSTPSDQSESRIQPYCGKLGLKGFHGEKMTSDKIVHAHVKLAYAHVIFFTTSPVTCC